MDVTAVQTWVTTVLTVTIVGHFSAGLFLGAWLVRHDEHAYHRLSTPIGLDVLGTLTAVLMVAAVRAIHRRRVVSPWLAVGLLVPVAGWYATFAR